MTRYRLTGRMFRILTGVIFLLFFVSSVVTGVKIADGLLRDVYQIRGSFAAAGQGLLEDSDVKIYGVNVGRVAGVSLRDGRALVRMDIESGERIPVDAKATIRPKTLFGEKFVDIEPGADERRGPFLRDEGVLRDTLGGFELEKVLTDLYPILKAVKPAELATVLSTLGKASEGLGPAINRQIANFAKVAAVQAEHGADTQQFLDDLAKLSEELAARVDDVISGARNLNGALPTLNARGDELTTFLEQAARLSADVADVLENNRSFLRKAVTEGGKAIDTVYAERSQLAPLIVGLRQFFQVLGEVTRIPFGDGTNLAAIKLILGEDCPTGRVPPCSDDGALSAPAATAGAVPPGSAAPATGLPVPVDGVPGLTQLIQGLIG